MAVNSTVINEKLQIDLHVITVPLNLSYHFHFFPICYQSGSLGSIIPRRGLTQLDIYNSWLVLHGEQWLWRFVCEQS